MQNINLSTEEVKQSEDLFAGLDKSILANDGFLDIDLEFPDKTSETDEALQKKKATEASTKVIEADKKAKEEGLIDIEDLDNEKKSTETTSKTTTSTADTTTTTSTNTDGADQTETEPLKLFAQSLQKEGVINANIKLDEFDGTVEGLKTILDENSFSRAKEMVEEYKTTLPPIIKYLADNYEEGVPLDELIDIKSNEIRYSNIDTEKLKTDITLQKAVYSDYLKKTTGFTQTKIDKELARLEDLEELEKEVEDALPELIGLEKKREQAIKIETKKQQEEATKRNQETLATIKKTAEGFKDKEIVPGIKLTDKDVQGLYKSLTTPVSYDTNGAPISKIQKLRAEDPIGFEIRLNHIAEITKGFTDFSAIIKKAKTEVAKQVEKAATSATTHKTGKDGITEDNDSTTDIMKAASSFLKKLK